MIAAIALLLAPAPAEAGCASIQALEGLHQQVSDSQLQPDAKDTSKKVAKQMLAHRKKGELCEPDAEFWAAMNLLLAREAEYADAAYEMAQKLMNDRHPRGPWLAGIAYDRMSIAKGAAQSYGTQTSVQNNKRCLIWTDLSFKDEDRVKMGHPKLADTIKGILEANGVAGAKPTVLELKNRGLWCKPDPWDGSRSDLPDPYDGRQ